MKIRIAAAVLLLSLAWVTAAQADPITGIIFGAAFAASIPGVIVSLGVTAATCYVVLAPKRRNEGATK